MIDRGTIDRIYAAANIADVVGDFVTLKKKGINFQACCPFHNEKTPSFVVSPTKGLYKCFGCGKGGNAVTFVMEHESMGYADALRYVAKRYGIEVQEREMSAEEVAKNDDRESMMVVSSWASDYFVDRLNNSDSGRDVALAYFRHRGFSDQTIARFALGWCPPKGDDMTLSAFSEGYKEEFLISTGLTIKREQGGYYDRFTGRVMFPIHSISGRVIAFGGRTLRTDKNVAKYLNSPESEIYHKSSVLYGLFQAKRAITHEDNAILVEGYTDVISFFQSGIENVVASSGTSLTEEQIRLISRFTKNITVIYDGDSAGIKASLRGIDMILQAGLNVRVVPLPAEDDPDSFARKNNATALREYINAHQEDFISFKTRILLADVGEDPIRRAELIRDIVQSISVIPDPISRSVFTKECARAMTIDEGVLVNEIARKRISSGGDGQTKEFVRNQQRHDRQLDSHSPAVVPVAVVAGSSIEELEREIIRCLIRFGESSFDYKEGKTMISLNVASVIIDDLRENEMQFTNAACGEIYRTYCHLFDQGVAIDTSAFITHPDPEVCNRVVDILTSDDNYTISKLWQRNDVHVESDHDRLSEVVPRIVLLYKTKVLEQVIGELSSHLSDESIQESRVMELMVDISKLNREKSNIARRLGRIIP